MKRTSRPTAAAAILLASVAAFVAPASALHAAQGSRAPAPAPEMQRLSNLYVGTWTYTETYPKSVSAPNGAVNTGVYTSEPGPGGNSLVNRFQSRGPAGDADGMLIIVWDPKTKAYTEYVFAPTSPTPLTGTGQWEGDTLVFRIEITAGTTKLALRNVARFLDGGHLSSDQFTSLNGGPETLLVHVDAVKK